MMEVVVYQKSMATIASALARPLSTALLGEVYPVEAT